MGEYPERNSSGDYLVFIPPVDDVKPIPVPVEIYTQCITDASRFSGLMRSWSLRFLIMRAEKSGRSAVIKWHL